jgi:anti-anti-sigma factor
MADARYPIVMIGGVPVVVAPAEIDVSNADWLRAVLREAGARGHAPVVVNMARTRFCDSAGVAALAWTHGLAVAKSRELLLVTPASAAVLRVLTLAGLDRFIPHFAHLNEALEHAHAVVPRLLNRFAMPPAAAGLPDA